MDLNKIHLNSRDDIKRFNEEYDRLASSKSVINLTKFITAKGAPIRILKEYFFSDENDASSFDLSRKGNALSGISQQIDQTLLGVKAVRNKAVIKSIIFLLLTKALIGIFVEIPYDLAVTGGVMLLLLVVNIMLPPAFLALSALTFRLPGIGFNVVQEVLFFIFFSTAAFLGFRITLQIKEVELLQTNQGAVALIRDVLYSPFIFLGKRISYRFGKLNLIARILDTAIDLPLKTFTRLIRQWVKFLSIKKDELN